LFVYLHISARLVQFVMTGLNKYAVMRVYPEVSGLATWNKNCKWCSSLPLGAVVSLFSESV